MALCESGKAAGTMIYAMGRANHFWKPWDVVSEKQRATWKKEILRDYAAVHAVTRSRGGGSAKAAASLTAGRAASISVRQIVGGDLETMLYTHLIVELGKSEFLLDDWVERVRKRKKSTSTTNRTAAQSCCSHVGRISNLWSKRVQKSHERDKEIQRRSQEAKT